MSKNNEPDDKPTSQSNNNHDQGAQSNQQANESAQANTNHPGSNPINAQSGDGSTTHIDNSDNSKGLEYFRDLANDLLQRLNDVQEKRFQDAGLVAKIKAEREAALREIERLKREQGVAESQEQGIRSEKNRSLKIAGLVATSAVMVGGALVVTYLPQEGIKKARSLPISVVDSVKNENPSKRKNKKSSYSDHVEIETGRGQEKKIHTGENSPLVANNEKARPGQEKKIQPFATLRTNKQKFQPKESFVDAMKRLEREKVEEFGVNQVLEGLLVQRSIAKVKGVDAPKVGQVFALGEKIEVGVDFGVLGLKEVTLSILGVDEFSDPVFSVVISGKGVSKVRLPKLGKGLWYLEIREKGKLVGAGKFSVR